MLLSLQGTPASSITPGSGEFFPEQTIRYKSYAKRTLVDGLNSMFRDHPDEMVQGTRATIEYPRTHVDFPCVVVRFFERVIFNAGVGHMETMYINGESASAEVAVTTQDATSVQLTWPTIPFATGYKLYKGRASDGENQSFTLTGNSFLDYGQRGVKEAVPTEITNDFTAPAVSSVINPTGGLHAGTYYYRVTALAPSQAVHFKHYLYTADIELAVYALSSLDRDLIADTLVQTITMGTLDAYTNTFFDRVYPKNDLFPDSELHFINVNSDQVQGFGETQMETPWGAEDDLMYMTSYRFGVFGELYSLPPRLSFHLVRQITQYPYDSATESPPDGVDDPSPWISNSP